jgi:hypothetical protein
MRTDAKEKKDEDWKEANNPFRAPKALDEEDVAFLTEYEKQKLQKSNELKEQDELDLQAFKVSTSYRQTNSPRLLELITKCMCTCIGCIGRTACRCHYYHFHFR